MTGPKIGSIIKFPYWEPDDMWVVLEYKDIFREDMEMYISASLVGGQLNKETLSVYIGEEKIDPEHYSSTAYWEYVE